MTDKCRIVDPLKFDPNDPTQAIEAAELSILLAITMLEWRAITYPNDYSLDSGWGRCCLETILRYGDIEHLIIPAIYERQIFYEEIKRRKKFSRPPLLTIKSTLTFIAWYFLWVLWNGGWFVNHTSYVTFGIYLFMCLSGIVGLLIIRGIRNALK